MLWRVIFILGCFLYASACAALAAEDVGHWAAFALLAAAIAHVVFGIDAILQSFIFSHEEKKDIGRLRMELESGQIKVAALQERISKLEEEHMTRSSDAGGAHTQAKVVEQVR